jgi:hypothetical protein
MFVVTHETPGVPTTWMKDNWILCNFTEIPKCKNPEKQIQIPKNLGKLGSWSEGVWWLYPKSKQTRK